MAISRLSLLLHQQLRKYASSLRHLSYSNRSFCSASNLPSHFQRIGFIGLGNMGSRMANNLIEDGYSLTVHDVNQNAMKIFSERGILTKESPFEVAESSDVLITMLPSSNHMNENLGARRPGSPAMTVNKSVIYLLCAKETLFSQKDCMRYVLDVYTGRNGLLSRGNTLGPWLLIDSSTIDPQTSRKLSATIADCSLKRKRDGLEVPAMLDAPVSGGILAAQAGTLTFMVGGLEEAYVAAKPLFLSMGKNTIYCGGAGNGSAAKICNNLAMVVSMLGVSEALALGQKLGIAASTLTKIFNSSSARCWSSDTYNPVPGVMDGVPASRNYDGGFASKLMAKDLNLATESAKEVGLEFPLTSQAEKIFTQLCNDGHGMKDFSCVFRHYYPGNDEL